MGRVHGFRCEAKKDNRKTEKREKYNTNKYINSQIHIIICYTSKNRHTGVVCIDVKKIDERAKTCLFAMRAEFSWDELNRRERKFLFFACYLRDCSFANFYFYFLERKRVRSEKGPVFKI